MIGARSHLCKPPSREFVMALKSFVPALYLIAAAGFYVCMAQASHHSAQAKVWPIDGLLNPAHSTQIHPMRGGVPLLDNQQSVRNFNTAPDAIKAVPT